MMSISFRPQAHQRRRKPSGIAVCALALAIISLAGPTSPVDAQDSCFRTGLPQTGLSDTGDHILRVHVDREDLIVEVAWADDPTLPDARLVLTAPTGEATAESTVSRFPGETIEILLPKALAAVPTNGFQYALELVDDSGTRAALPIRLTVDCPPAKPCVYRAFEGLTAGSLVVSAALWEALELARAEGSTDLMATVQATHPELAHELPGFLWQWTRGEAGSASQDQCTCRWIDVAEVSPLPGHYLGPEAAPPQGLTHTFGSNAVGAGFVAGIQALAGSVNVQTTDTTGRTRLGAQLLCSRAIPGGHQAFPTAWPSLPELTLEERALVACPIPCTPRIDYTARIRGCAQATAASRVGKPVMSNALVNVDLFVDGWSQIAGTATARINATAGQTARDLSELDDATSVTVHAPGLVSLLETSGEVEIDIPDASSTPYSYGFGAVSAEYSFLLSATATCSEIPDHHGALDWYLDAGNQGGGVAMERWEDP